MTDTVLEVGPAAVSRLSPHPQARLEHEMVAAALAGIDDTVVLFRERPVAVADLWRGIITAGSEEHCQSLTIVHPTWWTDGRVARLVDVATTVAADVRARPRSTMLTDGHAATVVEIADDLVAIVSGGRSPVVRKRTPEVADVVQVLETCSGAEVVIDAPPTVTGSGEYARSLRSALRHRGVPARLARIRGPAPSTPDAPVSVARRRSRGPALVAAGLALTVCAVGVTAARTHVAAPPSDAVFVAEGRITVRIPSEWVVTRITAGPGSRRIQATSPTDPNTALHVTQSYSPAETLERTADMLSRALDKQSRGVFVDFNPADLRGGRPAVTYRELRITREIRWTVFLDGATRISIGCESEHDRPDTIVQPCEQAIETAHELSGTNTGP